MTDFVVSITDPDQLAGITWAREQHNAAIPPPMNPPDTVTGGMAMPPMATQQVAIAIDTDEEYVQWVMEQAAISYADQQLRSQYQNAYETDAKARRERNA